jgi:hypothetical protein
MSGFEALARWFVDAPCGQPIEWDDVERQLGTALPADYKQLCDRFPPCSIGHFRLHHPLSLRFTPIEGTRIAREGVWLIADDDADPYWERMIAWGDYEGEPYYCWDTSSSSNPDEWSSLFVERGMEPLQISGPMTAYLGECVAGVQTVGLSILRDDRPTMAVGGRVVEARNWP